jgi:predicted permease
MGIGSDFTTRFSALFRRGAMQRDLDEELALHLELETEKLVDEGLSPEAARREAVRRFGGVQRHREEARDSWGVTWLDDLGRDLRVGARGLRRARGFTIVAVLTLGLGIGGALALYGAVYALLVRPLPFGAGDRIEVFWFDQSWRGEEFDHIRDGGRAFDLLAAYGNGMLTLRQDGNRVPVPTVMASAELFDVLREPAFLGRTFRRGEDRPGAEPVVVLAHALWQQEIGGDEGLVGRTIDLDGTPTTVIGVMGPDFFFPDPEQRAWRPLALDPADPAYSSNGWLVVIGRTAAGATPARVRADVLAIAARLGERFSYPSEWDKTVGAHSVPLRTHLFGEVRPVLRLLQAATALLLVMALVNVAALLLSRMVDRGHEMRLRAALGAGRGRLVRQVLAESVLIAAVAGGLGILFAIGSFGALAARLPLGGGFGDAIRLEPRLVVAAFGGAILLGVLVALAPLQRLLRDRPASLRPGARGETGASRPASGWLQPVLVATQIVVAVLMVAGATLFSRSAAHLYRVDIGLNPEGVGALTVGVDPATPGGPRAWVPRLLEDVRAVPGVERAAFGVRLPLRDGGIQGSTAVRDRPELTGEAALNAYFRPITPDYLETMGMRLLEGRNFTGGDRADSELVAVVNRTFAREVWPGESALGKGVIPTFGRDWARVVGVVADVPLEGVRAPAPRVVYVPYDQWEGAWPGGVLTYRTSGDPADLLASVRAAAERSDPTALAMRPTTLRQAVDGSIADALRLRFFLGALALLALLVGAVGVYGVVSCEVSRRTREYGIRMALGADRARVLRDVLRREAPQVVAGVIVGVGLALLAARAAAGLVYGVRPIDPVSLLVAAGALLSVGALAALSPALRASGVDPARVLRWE